MTLFSVNVAADSQGPVVDALPYSVFPRTLQGMSWNGNDGYQVDASSIVEKLVDRKEHRSQSQMAPIQGWKRYSIGGEEGYAWRGKEEDLKEGYSVTLSKQPDSRAVKDFIRVFDDTTLDHGVMRGEMLRFAQDGKVSFLGACRQTGAQSFCYGVDREVCKAAMDQKSIIEPLLVSGASTAPSTSPSDYSEEEKLAVNNLTALVAYKGRGVADLLAENAYGADEREIGIWDRRRSAARAGIHVGSAENTTMRDLLKVCFDMSIEEFSKSSDLPSAEGLTEHALETKLKGDVDSAGKQHVE